MVRRHCMVRLPNLSQARNTVLLMPFRVTALARGRDEILLLERDE